MCARSLRCVFWGWKNKPSIITDIFRAWPIFWPKLHRWRNYMHWVCPNPTQNKENTHPQLHLHKPSQIFSVSILTELMDEALRTTNVSAISSGTLSFQLKLIFSWINFFFFFFFVQSIFILYLVKLFFIFCILFLCFLVQSFIFNIHFVFYISFF